MREFETYSPEDIIAANLAEAAARQFRLYEQEYAHLRELATEIAAEEDLHELIASLPDHSLPPIKSFGGLADGIQRKERTRRCVLLAYEIARISCPGQASLAAAFFSDAEPISPSSQNHILYQRNGYTNEAFLQFSSLLGKPSAAYTHSYPASCEAVFHGEAEYCILPIESSSEGYLVGFAHLLEQYDLKIAATCDILGSGSARSTRFALVRRNLLPILSHPQSTEILDLRIGRISPCEMGEIWTAASMCGLTPHRIDTLPDPNLSGDVQLHLSLFTKDSELGAFLFYLAMEAPYIVPVGLYPNITH